MTLEPHGMNRRDIYILSFSDCYVFKSRICNGRLLSVFIFPVTASVEGLCCKPKYRANIIHHFIFVLFLYLFYHSFCHKDQFTVLSLKFGTNYTAVTRLCV